MIPRMVGDVFTNIICEGPNAPANAQTIADAMQQFVDTRQGTVYLSAIEPHRKTDTYYVIFGHLVYGTVAQAQAITAWIDNAWHQPPYDAMTSPASWAEWRESHIDEGVTDNSGMPFGRVTKGP